jgi:DNA-binding NtrC family response regulator
MPSPRAPRALIVDDEFLLRWSITQVLSDAGFDVVEAGTAAEARAALAADPGIPVALFDLKLPDSDDLGLLSDARRLAPACAVVMMTAHAPAGFEIAARAGGAAAILAKPFDLRQLPGILRRAAGLD